MSGIEIIGLVLGAFPLAVSALEHYRDACKTLGLLRNFEAEWRKTLNDIKDEQLSFTLTLKVLVLPLVEDEELDETDLETLLADPTCAKWKEDDVDKAMHHRLGSSHGRFMEIALELQALIWQLLTVIGIDKPRLKARLGGPDNLETGGNGKPRRRLVTAAFKEVMKTSFEYRKEQLKFGFGEPQRKELLKEIRTNNKKLDKLLEKSDKIASFKTSKTVAVSPKAVKSLLQYWRHADSVYALIHRSWGCTCQEQHCAHLWLQHRPSSVFEFKLLVLWSPRSLGAQATQFWQPQGLRVICYEGTVSAAQPVVSPAIASPSATPATVNAPAGIMSGGSRRRRLAQSAVRFCIPDPEPSMNRTVSASAPFQLVTPAKKARTNVISRSDAQLVREITKLCNAMTACDMQASCIGALTDLEKGSQYSVFSQPEQKVTAGETTLLEVLQSARKQRLRRSDRFRIALAVTSSHLQLHSTPWARKQWESQDIRFPQTSTGDLGIMFDRPYVAADFHSNLPTDHQTARKTDRSFACLGIMLMELLFGACLEDHELWQQLGFGENKTKPLFRLMVAREWADLVEDEAGPDFSAAVMWCLSESPATLEGDQWRKALADRVVLPLQNCCDWMRARPAG